MSILNFDGGTGATSAPALLRGINWGPVTITCTDSEAAPVPLAGWKAYAHVRQDSDAPLVLDLAPVIASNDAAGLITLPEIPPAASRLLDAGSFVWDLILEDPAGKVLPPVIGGTFIISSTVTVP